MKLSELQIGKEYAVVPSWTYNNRSARDVNSVRENDVVKATLMSKDKYEYEPSYRKSSITEFNVAKEGNRSVGVIVKAIDNNNNEIYWTSRLADIVAPYADLEPKWEAQKQAEADREREINEKRERIQKHREKIYAEVERSKGSITTTLKELLGDKTYVNVDTQGYEMEMQGVVTISLTEFEKLVELSYAGFEKENN